jgi:cation:H+ antiporter
VDTLVDVAFFIVSLALIFVGCNLFTNGVEWIGHKLNLSESVVGSVLAAVGTALPETIIPLIAIFFVGGATGQGVAIGAILGAPFMLGTIALFITGLAVLILRRRRETGAKISFDSYITRRDLSFFLLVYLGAVSVALTIPQQMKAVVAPVFVAIYVAYVWRVFKTDKGGSKAPSQPLMLDSWAARLKTPLRTRTQGYGL